MREIKFKWTLKNKNTGEIHSKIYTLNQLVDKPLHRQFDCYNYVIIGQGQYIGMSDKENNDIYGGDVLEDLGDNVRWLVAWRDEVAAFEFIEIESLSLATVNTWMPNADAVGYSYKIIGSEFETPDLIERKG